MCPSGAQLLPFSFPGALLTATERRHHPGEVNPTHIQNCVSKLHTTGIQQKWVFTTPSPTAAADTAVWLCQVHQGCSLMVCLDFLVYCFHENIVLAVHIPSREMQTSAGKTSHSTRLQVHKSVSIFCLLQMECSLLYLRIWGSDGETK